MAADPFYELDTQVFIPGFTSEVANYNAVDQESVPPTPIIKLVAHLDTYYEMFRCSVDGSLTAISGVRFAGRETNIFISDMVDFIRYDLSDAAAHEALSFTNIDVYPACGPQIAFHMRFRMQETMRYLDLSWLKELEVEMTVKRFVRLVYNERIVIASEERRLEEERARKRLLQIRAEQCLEEKECEDAEEGDSTCAVCLEEFRSKEKAAQMPCGHCFHKDCITKWLVELKGNKSCPLSRFTMD